MMTRGGKRKGAGPPLKYGEETEIVRFSVPKTKVPQIKAMVKKQLNQWEAINKAAKKKLK